MKFMPLVMVFYISFLCTRTESDRGSSPSLGVVLGGAFGGVVAVLAASVLAVVILRVKVYWRKQTGNSSWLVLQTMIVYNKQLVC